MGNHLYLVSPISPSVNHYLAYRAVMKHGRPMAMSYKTPEASKYQKMFTQYVKEQAIKQGWIFPADKYQHFYVDTVYYFDRIDMDGNNYFKTLLDAITDAHNVWMDDNVALERVQRIYYDSHNPRIELDIHPVDYIGVFDNALHLQQFKARCVGCVRYARNCTILRDAQIGRVQCEIEDGFCTKFKQIKHRSEKDGK